MPRQARKKSESGMYHIMLRGINQQQIFEDSEDCDKFIQILQECKAVSGFKLFAYCLMGNHIHLLIKPEKEPLEQVFKRIGGRYVYWYNVKYQRVGHLFQDRFKSEPVEDDSYFLTVIRYIHQNPVKAGLCKNIQDYKYSSYQEYISKPYLVDVNFVYDIVSKEEFLRYNHEMNADKCLEIADAPKLRVTDEQAMKIIENISHCKTTAEFQRLDSKSRDAFIETFNENGLSIRQISRLTGISKGLVEKSLKN
ncbi:MAG: transposase [Ruminococcus sp.]|nr:transposase [Ruminococcus sp.]